MNLRPYQHNACGSIAGAFGKYSSVLAVLATGLGKTVIFTHVANDWKNGRVLILAHREELIGQAKEKVSALVGGDVAVEMGENRSQESGFYRRKVVLASVQTLSRPERCERFDPSGFGLVVIDEAHHAVANTYRRVIDHFRQNESCKLLGVTATPRRADDLAMGQVFEHCCFDYGIEPAVDDGWLVPVRQRVVKVDGLDFSNVRSTAGDLNEADLERILSEEEHLHKVAAPTVELAGDHPTLVFCVTVNHARLLAEVIGRYKGNSAVFLSGETDKQVRRLTVERFKRGDIQFLCNVGLFLEGFDAPNTAFVVMARPTKSLPLYTQVLGRGTRPLPGVIDPFAEGEPAARKAAIAGSSKPFMTVLDFAGNSGRHKIVTAADVLGGKYGEPVRQYARKCSEEEGRCLPMDEALAAAEEELELLEEEKERVRRAEVKARKVEYEAGYVSPFAGGGVVKTGNAYAHTGDMATDKQRWKLLHLGIPMATSQKYTKKQASAVIDKLLKQRGEAV